MRLAIANLAAVKLALGTVVLLAAAPALGETPNRLGAWSNWSAWELKLQSAKECFAYAEPEHSEGSYTRRGTVSVAVTHRPSQRIKAEVSIAAGYPYQEGSEVKLLVDEQIFTLFTNGENAFARDSAADATLVEAMKRGRRMIVQGVSRRGTLTKDTYSLSGFTRSYQAISRACRL